MSRRRIFDLLITISVVSCTTNTKTIRSEWVPRALDSKVALRNEPLLDQDTGKVAVVHLEGIVTSIADSSRMGYKKQITLKSNDGTLNQLDYSLPSDVPLPIKQGERVVLQYKARWDSKAQRVRRAVYIQDGISQTRFIFQEQHLLEQALIPSNIRLHPTDTAIYTEIGGAEHFCYAVVEHRSLRLGSEDDGQSLVPGERVEVSGTNGRYLVVAVDNAKTVKNQCKKRSLDHLSWFVVRLPAANQQ